jgi:hypothetical protein
VTITESDTVVTRESHGPIDWNRVRLAGLATGLALLVEHVICYDEDAHKKRPNQVLFNSNALGVSTIAAGCALSGAPGEETARLLTIAAIGGMFVFAIRAFREYQRGDRFWRGIAERALGFSRGVRSDGWADRRSAPPYRGD